MGANPLMAQALASTMTPQTNTGTQATTPGYLEPLTLFGRSAVSTPPPPMANKPGSGNPSMFGNASGGKTYTAKGDAWERQGP